MHPRRVILALGQKIGLALAVAEIAESFARHKIKDIMSRDVVTTTVSTSMADAAKIMGERHIGSLIVMKYGTPIAIVTERDLLSRVLADGLDLRTTAVEQVMSYPLVKVCPESEIRDAMAKTPAKDLATLRLAAKRIMVFHRRQLQKSWQYRDGLGILLGQRISPLERVGVYVPAAPVEISCMHMNDQGFA